MSRQKAKVTLQVLENTYLVECDVHERNLLIQAADVLNVKLHELRRENPKMPMERLVIFGGLQMAFDLLQERQTFSSEVALTNEISGRLIGALDQAIAEENGAV